MTIEITQFWFERIIDLVRVLVVIGFILALVPMMVLWERKLIAYTQQRPGPNRVGPWGLLQTIVDGLKLFLKENIIPTDADHALHALAPLINVIPALALLAILPLGPIFHFQPSDLNQYFGSLLVLPTYANGYDLKIGIADLDIGILYYLAISGISVYGIVLAGWASNSKYALLGGIRSSAQMVSYELALGLSILGLLLITGTINLRVMIEQQSAGFWAWNIFSQPVGFCLFLLAGFAETNRLPFDLPEGESELGAGFHTEFSSMRFALFMLSEYVNIFILSIILSTLFLGGFHAPIPALMIGAPGSLIYAVMGIVWLGIKFFIIFSFMVLVRATLPRFRYDQLMDFGWKLMLPLALVNLVITAVVLALGLSFGWKSAILTLALLVVGVLQIAVTDRYLTIKKKRLLASC